MKALHKFLKVFIFLQLGAHIVDGKEYDELILVPMTLLRQNSYSKIIDRLIEDGIDAKLIILEGTYESIHDRILVRGEEEDCWCMQNIEMASAGSGAITGGYHISTDNKSAEQLTEIVLEYIKKDIVV